MYIVLVVGRDKMPIVLSRKDKFNDGIYNWIKEEKLNIPHIIE